MKTTWADFRATGSAEGCGKRLSGRLPATNKINNLRHSLSRASGSESCTSQDRLKFVLVSLVLGNFGNARRQPCWEFGSTFN